MFNTIEIKSVLRHVYNSYGSIPAVWFGFISRLIENLVSKCVLAILFAQIIIVLVEKDVRMAMVLIVVTATILLVVSLINSLGDHYFVKFTDRKYKQLAGDFHEKLLSKDISYFKSQSTAKINSLFRDHMDGTIRVVRLFRGEILSFLSAVLLPVIVLFFYNVYIALLILAIGLVEITFTNWAAYKVKHLRKDALAVYRQLTQEVSDQVLNISVVKASSNEDDFKDKVFNLAEKEEGLFTSRHRFEAFVEFLKGALIALGISIALYAVLFFYGMGGEAVEVGIITIIYLLQINLAISNSPELYKKFHEHIDRVFETLEVATKKWETISVPKQSKDIPFSSEIIFRNVSFNYSSGVVSEKANVFSDLNLTIPHGKHYAITGVSGSGKSTLAYLLMRFFDVNKGKISIGGIDIREFDPKHLRKTISYVPQQPVLFNRTIRENIMLYSSDASEGEMIEASKQALAHDFIKTLKDGYDTHVGELGGNMSGGQKQRIAIARALLKKEARIFIFDEITSALDKNAVGTVVSNIMKYLKGKSVLFITHNPEIASKMEMEISIKNQ